MKKYIYLSLLNVVSVILMSVGFVSCSKDDDDSNGSLGIPAYKDVSALYKVTSGSSEFSSFEFTESGNYVIVKKNNNYKVNSKYSNRVTGLMVAPWCENTTRSTSYNNIIYGKYTDKGNNTFELEGFGTVTVKTDANGGYSLEIAPLNSTPYTLTAAKQEQYVGSERTNNLCRTWRIENIKMVLEGTIMRDNKSYDFKFDENVNGGNCPELMYKIAASALRWAIDVTGESVPQSVIEEKLAELKKEYESFPVAETMLFAQTGTYLVTYANNTLAVSTWSWNGNSGNQLRYSWDYSNMNSESSGDCSIDFNGNRCIITEERSTTISFLGNCSTSTIYTLVEVK